MRLDPFRNTKEAGDGVWWEVFVEVGQHSEESDGRRRLHCNRVKRQE